MTEISVIIPIYNAEKYLRQCLDSVISQTFNNFEVICVDDGSTDNSRKILEEYKILDSRIKVILQDNHGVSSARNQGIENSTGDYLAFLDADDLLHIQFLEIMYNTAHENNLELVWCNHKKINDEKNQSPKLLTHKPQEIYYEQIFNKYLSHKTNIGSMVWGKLYRRDKLQDIRFDTNINIAEDVLFTHNILFNINRAAYIPENLIYYRVRSGSLSNSKIKPKTIDDHLYVATSLANLFRQEQLGAENNHLIRKQIAKICFKFCIIYPYKKDKTNYLKYWQMYAPVLRDMYSSTYYEPKFLKLKNRLKSYLFTQEYFSVLKWLIKL